MTLIWLYIRSVLLYLLILYGWYILRSNYIKCNLFTLKLAALGLRPTLDRNMTFPISDPLQVHLFKYFKITWANFNLLSLLLLLLLILVSITGLNPTFEYEISPHVGLRLIDDMKELIKNKVNWFSVQLKHKVYN
jgi:hypothetical protein